MRRVSHATWNRTNRWNVPPSIHAERQPLCTNEPVRCHFSCRINSPVYKTAVRKKKKHSLFKIVTPSTNMIKTEYKFPSFPQHFQNPFSLSDKPYHDDKNQIDLWANRGVLEMKHYLMSRCCHYHYCVLYVFQLRHICRMPGIVTLLEEILPKTLWQHNSPAQSKSAEMDTVPVQGLENA